MSKCMYSLSTLIILSVSSEYVNIAYKRPTWQKTTHSSNFGPPEKAVDGLKSDLSANGHQCCVSENKQRIASWRVNLLEIKFIHHVVIYYRTDNNDWGENNPLAGRFLGFSVYISDTESKDDGILCFHDTEYNMTTIPSIVNITCALYGQYVIYYNERNSDTVYPSGYSKYAYNELCEVEVYGCALGYYGPNCSLLCPIHCQNCNTETGDCLWCDAGYTGKNCDSPCGSGSFGVNCTNQCGECGGYCDHVYGNCSGGCNAGYHGIMCNEVCPPRKYGANCGEYCGKCGGECDHVHGTCSGGCQPGYVELKCKTECASRSYGLNCSGQCGECLGDCNHVDGHCPNGCKAGYVGINCTEECALGTYGLNCSGHCGECNGGCSNVDGSCAGGCKAGYEGITCHDVCDFGFFGVNCQHQCSMFCSKSRNCSRISGHCIDGCKSGWEGMDCLEMRNQKVKRVLGSTEIVAVVSISLSVNVCLLCVYCLRRYDSVQKRKLPKSYLSSSRHDQMSASVQTGPSSLDDEEHSEREYNELQFLHNHTDSDYYNT